MIYEWYSGSDKTLGIPKRLTKLYAEDNESSHEERVFELDRLLELEEDRNWKAYLHYSIAQELREADDLQVSTKHFIRALEEFDPLAGNFENVIEQYCRTAFHLVRGYYIDSDQPERAAAVGLAALSWLDCADFDDFEASMFLSALGTAFNLLGNKSGVDWYYHAALGFKTRAHHLESEDPGRVQGLIYSLYNVDKRDDCLRAFEMFQEISDGFESKQEVEDFVRDKISDGRPKPS